MITLHFSCYSPPPPPPPLLPLPPPPLPPPPQVLTPSSPTFYGFGWSLTGGLDLDNNSYPGTTLSLSLSLSNIFPTTDITIGSLSGDQVTSVR